MEVSCSGGVFLIREGDDEVASVVFPPKDHLYLFYGTFRCELEVGDDVCSRDGFLVGEGATEGVDGEMGDGGYA